MFRPVISILAAIFAIYFVIFVALMLGGIVYGLVQL